MPGESLLIASGFGKFRYAVSDASGRARGELRLKTLPKDPIAIDFDGRGYRIDYVRTRDDPVASDFRFSLVAGNGEALASADKARRRRDFNATLRGVGYRFERRASLFSLRYAVLDGGGKQVGTLRETTGFSLWKRRFRLDLPEGADGAFGVFLFFLAVNLHFR